MDSSSTGKEREYRFKAGLWEIMVETNDVQILTIAWIKEHGDNVFLNHSSIQSLKYVFEYAPNKLRPLITKCIMELQ